MRTFKELCTFLQADLARYTSSKAWHTWLYQLVCQKGFTITWHYRVARYLHLSNNPLFIPFNFYYKWVQLLYSCEIPYSTHIGEGLYFGHVFGTVVSHATTIGKQFTLSHNVTIGTKLSPEGIFVYPTIGDHVYIAAGAAIIGQVHVGDNVAIGTNAVVTKSIPNHAVVVGVPAKILSFKGNDPCLVPKETAQESEITP